MVVLVDMLLLDLDKVIIWCFSGVSFMINYYFYNFKNGEMEFLFMGSICISFVFFDLCIGKVLVKLEIELVGGDYEQWFLILNFKIGLFDVQNLLSMKFLNCYEVNVVGLDDVIGKYYVLINQFLDKIQVCFYDVVM